MATTLRIRPFFANCNITAIFDIDGYIYTFPKCWGIVKLKEPYYFDSPEFHVKIHAYNRQSETNTYYSIHIEREKLLRL